MTFRHARAALAIAFLLPASVRAQGLTPRPAEAAAFVGTWTFTMTEPEEFRGVQQTVRIWERDGALAATFQTGTFPSREATGIFKDGDMLLLTIGHSARPQLLENGAPIWVVISLTLEGGLMRMAQMIERSRTTKLGTGRKVGS